MKNLSLTVKIWLALSLISLLLYVVVIMLMPSMIRSFFTATLAEPPGPAPRNVLREQLPPYLSVRGFNIRSFILLADGTTIPAQTEKLFSEPLYQQVKQNAMSQQQPRQLYEYHSGPDQYRYNIRKDMAYGQPLYQVTFLRESEEDNFVATLLSRIILFAGIVLLISWFASLFIARYLTKPLVQMQQHVKRIANRHWHEPLVVTQSDEIGQLANSIETMRQQLVQQNNAQQSMLQNVSHELKTPVMVIRSYARAIQDGVYPKGDLAGSIQVIEEEGERLEKLVKQLLYLTRLDYLASGNISQEKIHLDKLIEDIAQRMNLQRAEITWQLELQPATVNGDEDTLRSLVENLIDNHLRHAVSRLEITLTVNNEQSEATLRFWNDGSTIEPHILSQLFQPFQKGREGSVGLGLAIVQRIVKMHQGRISMENKRDGVSSTVLLPLRK
ncbi:Sensor histidine kinase CssS [Pelotomaculum sp. FP]|uniref:sensor histidine kinase n=1 Tax=Pelotomaculum sp. FP TaxID=261474 RepID=UPI0010666014|nr:HAMP domain-containing sensor histidine kinase [Pelotomaculum sp. FP]TEB11516.1 Sensor histidine kinase CssS [Pelotomaculum sp. FP]